MKITKDNTLLWIIGIIAIIAIFILKPTFLGSVVNPDFNTANLISYYSFDTNANDNKGTNEGTIHGGATIDNELVLDGIDSYVSINNIKPQQLSVAFKIKLSELGQINTKPFESSKNNCIAYGFDIKSTNQITFDIDTCISGITTSTTILDVDKFYFIVGTYDGYEAKLYIDGILEDSAVVNKTIKYDNESVFIGAGHNETGDAIEFFKGTIDELSIYDAALTQGQITSLYNNGNITTYLIEETCTNKTYYTIDYSTLPIECKSQTSCIPLDTEIMTLDECNIELNALDCTSSSDCTRERTTPNDCSIFYKPEKYTEYGTCIQGQCSYTVKTYPPCSDTDMFLQNYIYYIIAGGILLIIGGIIVTQKK